MFLGEEISSDDEKPEQISNNNNNIPQQQQNMYQPLNNNQSKGFKDEEIEDLDDVYTTKTQNSLQTNSQSTFQQSNNNNGNGDFGNNQSNTYESGSRAKNRQARQLNKIEQRYEDRQSKLNQAGQTLNKNHDKHINNPQGYHVGINFDNKLEGNNQYEPQFNKKIDDDLPILSGQNNRIQFNDNQPDGNLKVSDDSDNDYKPSQNQQQNDGEEEEKENGVINDKELFSDESEDEEEEVTQQMQDLKKEHENDDEDDAAQVQVTKNEDEPQQPQAIIAKPIEDLEIPDMKEFLTRPLPKGVLLQCTIKRDKSGMGHFYPKYHVYLSKGVKHIMSGKKRSGCKTSNYLIGMDKSKIDKKSPGFLAKVRSNFLGTEFHVYDTGVNPKDSSDYSKFRKELACCIYESNLLGAKGPRKMRVLIPDVDQNTDEPVEWKPIKESDSMLAKFKNNELKGMNFYYNKPPKWNEHVQAFVLNFNGRVDKPSVKNFQLVNDANDEIIYLQFGRVGDDLFNMDLQWPMSPLQAFGICLSSFDYKIACE